MQNECVNGPRAGNMQVTPAPFASGTCYSPNAPDLFKQLTRPSRSSGGRDFKYRSMDSVSQEEKFDISPPDRKATRGPRSRDSPLPVLTGRGRKWGPPWRSSIATQLAQAVP